MCFTGETPPNAFWHPRDKVKNLQKSFPSFSSESVLWTQAYSGLPAQLSATPTCNSFSIRSETKLPTRPHILILPAFSLLTPFPAEFSAEHLPLWQRLCRQLTEDKVHSGKVRELGEEMAAEELTYYNGDNHSRLAPSTPHHRTAWFSVSKNGITSPDSPFSFYQHGSGVHS